MAKDARTAAQSALDQALAQEKDAAAKLAAEGRRLEEAQAEAQNLDAQLATADPLCQGLLPAR